MSKEVLVLSMMLSITLINACSDNSQSGSRQNESEHTADATISIEQTPPRKPIQMLDESIASLPTSELQLILNKPDDMQTEEYFLFQLINRCDPYKEHYITTDEQFDMYAQSLKLSERNRAIVYEGFQFCKDHLHIEYGGDPTLLLQLASEKGDTNAMYELFSQKVFIDDQSPSQNLELLTQALAAKNTDAMIFVASALQKATVEGALLQSAALYFVTCDYDQSAYGCNADSSSIKAICQRTPEHCADRLQDVIRLQVPQQQTEAFEEYLQFFRNTSTQQAWKDYLTTTALWD